MHGETSYKVRNIHNRKIEFKLLFPASIAVALDASVIANIRTGQTQDYYSEYLKANDSLSHLAKYAVSTIRDYIKKLFE